MSNKQSLLSGFVFLLLALGINPGSRSVTQYTAMPSSNDARWLGSSWSNQRSNSITSSNVQAETDYQAQLALENRFTLQNAKPDNMDSRVTARQGIALNQSWIEWVGKSSSEINGPVEASLAEYNLWLPMVFGQNIYTVTITTVGNGSVGCNNPGPYHYGDVVQLTATPATGWRFANWTGDLTGSTNPVSITIDGNKSVTARFTQNEYTLTVTTVGNGSVSRNNPGPYHYGDVVQLTATPSTGWRFSNWTGDITGSTNPASITINGNRSVTARFTQNEYTLTVTTVGNGSVSRNNSGPYHYGDVVQLTAAPVTGWSFAHWTGDLTGSANPISITINGNKSVTAHFTQNEYTLTITPVGSGSVSRNNPGPYHYGDVVQLTAVPNGSWSFHSWTGDLTGSTNPTSITINGNKSVTALFTEYTLTVTTVGNGSVSRSNFGPYHYGDVVQLTATPVTGWSFADWTGDLTGNTNPASITIDGNKNVTARFTQNEYTLTITTVGNGSVSRNNSGPYHYGDVIQLTAVPDTGWIFDSWTNDLTGSTNPASITISGNKTITALFTVYRLTITTVGSGSVSRDKPLPYQYGDVVELTAIPTVGWSFDRWTGDLTSSTNPASITMDGNKSVTAHFTQDEYTLSVSTIGNGSVSRNIPGPYHYGDVVQLTATPVTGWRFSYWTGDHSGSANPVSITIYGDMSVTARFTQIEYTLTVTPVGNGSVSRNNWGPYHYGDVVQLTAIPDAGWEFFCWRVDLTGNNNPATITMNGNKVVTANFTHDEQLPKDLIINEGVLREDFETLDGWGVSGSASGYSAVIDTTNYKAGTNSIKLTTPSGGNVIVSKSVNWDLSAQAEQGNFRLWVYVYGTSEPAGFQIHLSNDAGFQNYYVARYGSGIRFRNRPGWNLINLRKSDWTVGGGAPSWTSPTVGIRFRVDGVTADSYSLDGLYSGVIARPAILFTFDDGKISLYTQAYAYMKTRNVRGTGYPVTDWVNGTNQATWPQLQEMYAAGWTIGNHTKTHSHLPSLSEADQESELMGARSALNAHGLTNVDYVCYPYGEYDNNTLTAMANLGMHNGRTLLYGNFVSPVAAPYEIPQREIASSVALSTAESWVDTAKSRQEILVIVFHVISANPAPDSDDWSIDNFQSLVDYGIQQGVPIITMDDLYWLQYGSVTIPGAR